MEMELRQRRKPAAFGDKVPDEKGKIKTSQKIDQTFTRIICVILFFLMIILGGTNLFPDHPVSLKAVSIFDSTLNKLGLAPKVYAVVLDAGSTGSRVLAFTFHKNPVTSVLVLEDELFAEVKPGLSSFAQEPTKAAEAIDQLLQKAKSRIPQDMWRKTPVALKATAGQYGEISQDLHDLLKQLAVAKAKHISLLEGRPLSASEQGLLLHHLRRRLSVSIITAQSHCLLTCLNHMAPAAKEAAKKRAFVKHRQELEERDRLFHFEAFVKGRHLHDLGVLHP